MMKVGVFINNLKLDLFADENIELNLSAQNVKDITKFYSDYTQSFTVPASKFNNQVFKHWYDSDIEQFNANVKLHGHIEINGLLFKEGVYLLEKANKKDGNIYSYTIAFSTAISSLKDIIGEATLQDIDYGVIAYNETEVSTYIGQNYGGIYATGLSFPLISSNRLWTYGDSSANDISTVGGSVKWNELFPAVSLNKILHSIESAFSIGFGDFLNDDPFNFYNFIWFKNKALVGGIVPITTTEVFTNDYVFPNEDILGEYLTKYVNVKVITTYTGSITVKVYKNGTITNVITVNGNGGTNDFSLGQLDVNDLSTYKFGIVTGAPLTFNVDVTQSGRQYLNSIVNNFPYSYTYNNVGLSTTADLEFRQLAPKVKIMDFIKNYLTLINGVIHFKNGKYIIEPLERYYTRGRVIDITPYVNIEGVEYQRVKLPKKLSFNHAENNAVTNYNYNSLNNPITYGNTSEVYDYDGSELEFQSGFEVTLFNQLVNNLWVGYSIDKDGKEIIPKLQLIGYSDGCVEPFKLNSNTISFSAIFTNQYISLSDDFISSNTFSVEDGFHGIENQTLYQTYYLPYIGGLFNNRNRQVNIQGQLPYKLINDLQLYDAILFDQKQYTINDMKLNLVNGNFTASLLTNFRPQYREVLYYVDEYGDFITHDVDNPTSSGAIIFNDYTPQSWVTVGTVSNLEVTFNVGAMPPAFNTRTFKLSYVLYIGGAPTYERCRITIIQNRVAPLNALLTEDGQPILTEDGQYITTE